MCAWTCGGSEEGGEDEGEVRGPVNVMESVIPLISDRDQSNGSREDGREGVLRLIRSPMEFGSPLICAHWWEYDLQKGKGSGDDDLGACQT